MCIRDRFKIKNIIQTDSKTAELTKYMNNTFFATKVSIMNEFKLLCDKIGANWEDALLGFISDGRIGNSHLNVPGHDGKLGYGGTCFPRDTFAFNHLNKSLGLSTDLFDSIDSINRFQDQSLFERVLAEISDDNTRKVGILGMAFKPSTPVIEQSVGVKLLDMLLTSELALDISISDFYATDNIKSIYGDKINYSSSHMDCLNNSDIVIFINNENNFVNDLKSFRPDRKITIIDCWRSLDEIILDDNLRIIRWGSFTN